MYSPKLEQVIKDHRPVDTTIIFEQFKAAATQCGLDMDPLLGRTTLVRDGDIVIASRGEIQGDYDYINLGSEVWLTWREVVQGHYLVFEPRLRYLAHGGCGEAPDIEIDKLLALLDIFPLCYDLPEETVELPQVLWGPKRGTSIYFLSEVQNLACEYIHSLAAAVHLVVHIEN